MQDPKPTEKQDPDQKNHTRFITPSPTQTKVKKKDSKSAEKQDPDPKKIIPGSTALSPNKLKIKKKQDAKPTEKQDADPK